MRSVLRFLPRVLIFVGSVVAIYAASLLILIPVINLLEANTFSPDPTGYSGISYERYISYALIIDITLSVVLAGFVTYYLPVGTKEPHTIDPQSPDKIDTLTRELNDETAALSFQRGSVGALCVIVALYSAFQATQAIAVAETSAGYDVLLRQTQANLENLNLGRGDLLRRINNESNTNPADATTDDLVSELNKRVALLDTRIAQETALYEQQFQTSMESEKSLTGQFVFSLFSVFFVRVATVVISLTFFAICFGQFRRVDQRFSDIKTLRFAYAMTKEGVDHASFSAKRDAIKIVTLAQTLGEDDIESALPRRTIGIIASTLDQLGLRDTFGRSNQSQTPGSQSRTPDAG